MKKILISLAATCALVACAPSDQAPEPEYFDQITPIPGEFQATNAQPIPPLAPSPVETAVTPSGGTTQVDTDGVEYEVVTVDVNSLPAPVAEEATAAASAPAPGLYEPALAAPQEADKPKRAAKPIKPASVKPRGKALNLQEYGASQTHLVGEKKYSRSKSKYAEGGNCDQYSIAEIAQIAFLNAGGPRKDPLLLDADGDGFACAWVPQR